MNLSAAARGITIGFVMATVNPPVQASEAESVKAWDAARWSPLRVETRITEGNARAYRDAHEEELAAMAYLFALPAFMQYRQRFQFLSYLNRNGVADPLGQFMLLRQPATPQSPDVFPNVDTLYGAAFLELGKQPAVLTVPDIPGRYFSLALLDAYFYNFDYVGSRTTGQGAGTYLLVGPDWNGAVPQGIDRVIRAPTGSIHIYQRIYFRDTDDILEVRRLQDRIRLTPLARFLAPQASIQPSDLAIYMDLNPLAVKDPLEVLTIANHHMTQNPPPLQDRTLVASFEHLGIGPGRRIPDDGTARQLLGRGAIRAQQIMASLWRGEQRSNSGWRVPAAAAGARGGTGGVALHAMHQLRYIGINVPAEAVYLTATNDVAGQPLRGGDHYRIRFPAHKLPPLQPDRHGFWSLTIYDAEHSSLVANSAQKYAVRSADPLKFSEDGSLTLYIQPEPPSDPALHANWLPSPATGEVVLMLRIYIGNDDVVAGRYSPPAVYRLP